MAAQKAYYKDNRDSELARRASYYQANQVEILSQQQAQYEENKSEVLARNKVWRDKQPPEVLAARNAPAQAKHMDKNSIKRRARKALENVNNVETVLGEEDDPKLPVNEIDLAFIVDAYHEFSFPREMGERLKESLKPGGQLVLVEYRAEDPGVPIKRLHKMSEVQVKQEMAAIGLDWVRTESYLPQQHVLIFQKPRAQP